MAFYNYFANFNISNFGFRPTFNFNFGFNIGLNTLMFNSCNFFRPLVSCFYNPYNLYNYNFNAMPMPSLTNINNSIFSNNIYQSSSDSWTPTTYYADTYTPNLTNISLSNEFSAPSFTPKEFTATNDYKWGEFKIKTVQSSSSSSQKSKFTGTLEDYNAENGKKLARIALANSPKTWKKECATYVKNAIKDAGLGEYETGDAHEVDNILAKNPNFKQISTENIDVNELPAGCILVYEKGVQGYDKNYGHVEITTGDKRGVSDGITNNLREPSSIFIPV